MSTDDLTAARAFGLAARVAELEDQLAKLRHYHFSTLLTLAAMGSGRRREGGDEFGTVVEQSPLW